MRQKFIADKVSNLGIGLIVGSFLLRISDSITFNEQVALVLIGLVNVALGLIIFPDE